MKRTNPTPPPADRLPPHDLETEAAVLSCMLRDPQAVLSEMAEKSVTIDWFYDLRHQHLFTAMTRLYEDGRAVDVITVGGYLKDQQLLEQLGGYPFLSALDDLVASPAQAPDYLVRLREKWMARNIVSSCTLAVTETFEATKPIERILAGVEAAVVKLNIQNQTDHERRMNCALGEAMNELEEYHRGQAQIHGLTTGIEYCDKLLCGFGGENGNYIVISGRPGKGKTSLAMQIAMHVAIDHIDWQPVMLNGQPVMEDGKQKMAAMKGVPVGVFTLEMATKALVKRMLFERAGADMQRWRTGFAVAEDYPPLIAASKELANSKIFIDDTGRCTIEQLKAKARRMHHELGIRCFVIDYIQLMRSSSGRFRNDRVQELAEISGEIVNLTKELNVPVIVLAQMNRDYEKEPNRAPRLSDLKDCGSIEQDADLVGFLYTPKKAEDQDYKAAMNRVYGDDWSKMPGRVDLLWAKNRYGPSGKVQLLFQRSCTRFVDYNVWLKDHGVKAPAAGELSQYKEQNREPKPDDYRGDPNDD